MKITGLKIDRITTRLKRPFVTSLRRLEEIDTILITLTTDTGLSGYGGAAPTAVITGETFGSITAAVEYIVRQLIGKDARDLEQVMEIIDSSMVGNSSAKAAVDMAVYDLYGKAYSAPLYKLLGGYRDHLQTDITISMSDPARMAADSRKAIESGFRTLKIKLGNGSALDMERMKAVRAAAGPDISLRVDANQGWNPKEAVDIIGKMQIEGINPEFIEQPVSARDFEGMRFVRERIPFPLVADESVFSPKDALDLVRLQAVDGFNIKLMKTGGIHNALKIAAIADAAGLFCMVGSMMESHTGLTAAAHFAASRSVVTEIDLDVPLLCSTRAERGGTEYSGSAIRLPDGPGLGITGWEG